MAICLGSNNITKVYKGTSEISKVYLGTLAIYNNTPTPTPTPTGVEPNDGDKILVQDFETNSRAYGNLTLVTDTGVVDSAESNMGSYSYRIKAYDEPRNTAKTLQYHIGEDYLGRNFTLEFFGKWSWTSGQAYFFELMDSTSKTGVALATYNFGRDIKLFVNDFSFGDWSNVGTSKAWNHYAFTHDVQNGITFYCNGAKVGTCAAAPVFRNGREYDLKFFCYRGGSNDYWIDGINMEYGLKYTGDTYTVPTSYSAGTIFTPSGTYVDNLTSHNLTYASEYTSKLVETNQTLPVTVSTTESTITRSMLDDATAEYTGSDTENIYTFNSWQVNGGYIFNTNLTVNADWTIRSASGSGIFLIGDITSWQVDPDYEFQWSDADNAYVLENVSLGGEWKIGDDYFSQVNIGASSSMYELQDRQPYTYTNRGANFYSSGVHISKLILSMTNGIVVAVY